MGSENEGRSLLGFAASLLGGLVACMALGYFLFLFPGCGSVSRHVAGGGFSSGSAGFQWGSEVCNVGPGQAILVEYAVKERRSGFLNVYFWNAEFFAIPKILEAHKVEQEGTGVFRFKPGRPGRYRVSFSPVPDGRGYDFSYEASWKVE